MVQNGGHMNYLQFSGGGTFGAVDVEYNTGRQASCGGAEGIQLYNNDNPSTVSNILVGNNTLIALAPVPANSCASPNQSVTMSNIIHGPNTTTPLNISGTCSDIDNYFDLSGALGAFYVSGGGVHSMVGCTGSGNINMVTAGAVSQ